MVFGALALVGAEIAGVAATTGLTIASMGGDGIDDMVQKDNVASQDEAQRVQRQYVDHARQQRSGTGTSFVVSLSALCLVCCMMVSSMITMMESF
jgi:Na+/glutamate symporter